MNCIIHFKDPGLLKATKPHRSAKAIPWNAVILCAGLCGHVEAATYFVDPKGSDSAAGTIQQPLATLHEANERVLAGDTVYIRGGTYLLPLGQPVGITISKNKAQGFYANHSHGGSDWFNNTAFENRGADFDMYSDIELSGEKIHKLRNNVADPTKIRNQGASDMQYNSWNLGVIPTKKDFVSASDEGFIAPRKPDGMLPDLNFLKPRPGGQLIDKGTDVGLPFHKDAPDLGAYECGS